VNAIQKPLFGLKNVLTKHFSGFGSGFTERHAKLDVDTLLNFAIHRRQNKTKSKKHPCTSMHIHSAVSHGRLIQ
jgi:hypothetical protein